MRYSIALFALILVVGGAAVLAQTTNAPHPLAATAADGGTWLHVTANHAAPARAAQAAAAIAAHQHSDAGNPYVHKMGDGSTYYGVLLPDGGIPPHAVNPYRHVLPDGGVSFAPILADGGVRSAAPTARVACTIPQPGLWSTHGDVPNCPAGQTGKLASVYSGGSMINVPVCCPK